MAIQTKTALTTAVTTNVNDNVTRDISPSDVRTILTDMVDTLWPQLQAHDPAATYASGDVVMRGGNLYKANKAISAQAFAAADWDQVTHDTANLRTTLDTVYADLMKPVSPHSTTATYAAGDVVMQGGGMWQAGAGVATGAFTAGQWTPVGLDRNTADTLYANALQPIAPFNAASVYSAADMVLQGGHVWVATGSVTAKAFDPTEWTQLTTDIGDVTSQIVSQERFQGVATTAPTTGEMDWDNIPAASAANQGHYYIAGESVTVGGTGPLNGVAVNAGDMIYSDGAAYQVVATGVSGTGGLTKAQADGLYATIKHPIQGHLGTRAYAQGDQVIKNGVLWESNAAIAAHAWVASEWTQMGLDQATADTVYAPIAQPVPAFNAASTYVAGDQVLQGGMLYTANGAVTAKAFSAAEWTVVGAGATAPPGVLLWQPNTPYADGTIVSDGFQLQRYDDWNMARPTLPGSAAFNQADWTSLGDLWGYNQSNGHPEGELISDGGEILVAAKSITAGTPFARTDFVQATIPVWSGPNQVFSANQYIWYKECLYQFLDPAGSGSGSGATPDLDVAWKEVGSSVPVYDSRMSYASGKLVWQGNQLYRANKDTTATMAVPTPFAPADWDAIAPPASGISAFAATGTYSAGDLVTQGGHIYSANTAVTPAAFTATQWNQITVDPADVTAQIVSQERFQGVATTAPTTGEVDWDNIPAASAANQGHYYIAGESVTVGGTGPLNGTAVNAGDLIYSDGAAYQVVATGGSGVAGLTKPQADAAYAPIAQPVQAWQANTAYAVGDQVMQGGKIYVSTFANPGTPTFSVLPPPGMAGAVPAGTTFWAVVGPSTQTTTPANAAADTTAPTGGSPGDIVIGEFHVWVHTPGGTWKKLLLDSPFGP